MFHKLATRFRNYLPRQSLVGQFVRYFFTGGLAFVVDFALFALCLYVFHWHYLLANFVGLIVGLALNYAVSISWVFSTCERSLKNKQCLEFSVFALVGILGIGFNLLIMFVLVGKLDIQEMISKIIAASIVLAWNFLARKLILFRDKKV